MRRGIPQYDNTNSHRQQVQSWKRRRSLKKQNIDVRALMVGWMKTRRRMREARLYRRLSRCPVGLPRVPAVHTDSGKPNCIQIHSLSLLLISRPLVDAHAPGSSAVTSVGVV